MPAMDGYTILIEKDSDGCVAIALDDGCNVVGMVACPEGHDARRRLQAHLDCGLVNTRDVGGKRQTRGTRRLR